MTRLTLSKQQVLRFAQDDKWLMAYKLSSSNRKLQTDLHFPQRAAHAVEQNRQRHGYSEGNF
ncbi:MAG: hypothetical protein WBW01_10600, partial [Terriglobales bacterium]